MSTEQPNPAEKSITYPITMPSALEIGTARKIAVFPFVAAPGASDKSRLIIIYPASDGTIRSWSTTGATPTTIGREHKRRDGSENDITFERNLSVSSGQATIALDNGIYVLRDEGKNPTVIKPIPVDDLQNFPSTLQLIPNTCLGILLGKSLALSVNGQQWKISCDPKGVLRIQQANIYVDLHAGEILMNDKNTFALLYDGAKKIYLFTSSSFSNS